MALTESKLTEEIIGAGIEVHRHLGPGLLESAYRTCLAHELTLRGIKSSQEKTLPIEYKGCKLDCGYRMDLVVEEKVLVELKCVERMIPLFDAQILSYLKLSGLKVGLLVNFHTPLLKDGISRFVL